MTFPRGQLATEVRPQIRQGLPGDWQIDSQVNEWFTGLNVKPQTTDVWTFTVNAATSSHDYTVVANGASVVYTSDSTATIDEIVLGLGAAIAAEPLSGCNVTTDIGANTITCTSWHAGVTNTFTESEGDLALAHTATGAGGEAIPFGVAVCSDGYASDGVVKDIYLPKTTYFAAQVATCDYTYNNTSILGVRVTNLHTGITYTTQVVQGTSKDASTTALANSINDVLPANTVVATNDGAGTFHLVLTAEVAGLEFAAELFCSDDATCHAATVLTTGPSVATSVIRAFAGIAMRDGSVVPSTLTALTADYPANYSCTVASKGCVWVTNAQAPSFHDLVYVECDGTSASIGKMYNTSSATRLAMPYMRWERSATTASGDSLAGVFVNNTLAK